MKFLNYLPVFFLCLSCGNNRMNENTKAGDAAIVADTISKMKNESVKAQRHDSATYYYTWEVNRQKKTVRRNPNLSTALVNTDSIIKGLNLEYKYVLLEKTGIQHDTLRLIINDSEYLTGEMGADGFEQYIAQAIINLTSVPGIRYVQIDFKKGSYASPGIWSRNNFPGYIIVH